MAKFIFTGDPYNIAEGLVENLQTSQPLSPAQQVDFGIKSGDHYRALQKVARSGGSDELIKAYGNGPEIADLVKKHAPECSHLEFQTPWDLFRELGFE